MEPGYHLGGIARVNLCVGSVGVYIAPDDWTRTDGGVVPPNAPWGLWLKRALLAPWERWDAAWYLRILTQGYQMGDGSDAFHPLYPWLAWPLIRLGLDPLLSLMLMGNLSTMAFLLIFERMATLDSTLDQAQTASRLLLFFPVAFILFAPYNEGFFFCRD
jgi:hypothetical protein